MNLDTLVVSILFDDAKTAQSAKKIQDTVGGVAKFIKDAFISIMSIDFLKKAIEDTITLTTKLDNLSYATNSSKEDLNAFGEAAKRNGGSIEGFSNSITSLSTKIIDMQTSFGSSGQLVFARLGLNLQKSNGEIKTATELLGDIGDKFKLLPKVWQLKLGAQLGLDQATIRLISSGNAEAQKLVAKMKEMSAVSEINTEKTLKFRNALYDLQLIWQSIKINIANFLIPLLKSLTDLLGASFKYLREHAEITKVVLTAMAAIISGKIIQSIFSLAGVIATRLIPAFAGLLAVTPEFLLLGVAFVGIALVAQDFYVWLKKGNSELDKLYESLRKFTGFQNSGGRAGFSKGANKWFDETFGIDTKESVQKERTSIGSNISDLSKAAGFDPDRALTISQIESGLRNVNNSDSTATGPFQLINKTFNSVSKNIKGNRDLLGGSEDIYSNIVVGIENLKETTKGLSKFLGRAPTGGELYLGERLGLPDAIKTLSAPRNRPVSQILGAQALFSNKDFRGKTAGQLISSADKSYQDASVVIQNLNINTPTTNPQSHANIIKQELSKQRSNFVTNNDNGVRQ